MNYKQIAATNQIKVGAGKIKTILISSTTAGTLTVYDSQVSSTGDPVIIATLTPAAGALFDFGDGLWFNGGLYMVITDALEVTVVYE